MTRPATPLLNDARARASRLRRALAQALYPPVCLGCRRLLRASGPHDHGRTEREVPLCSRCAPELAELPPEARVVDGVEAVFAHDGPLRRAITALKFNGQLELAGPLARLLARADCVQGAPPWDVLVPVPLHPWRATWRGFNQAAVLATTLAGFLHERAYARVDAGGPRDAPRTPVALPGALRRTRATRPQTALRRSGRHLNVLGAIVARRPDALAGRRVLVIDDVTTTGATMRACRAAASQAGASRTGGLALLRALS